jgi:hypothetical protein
MGRTERQNIDRKATRVTPGHKSAASIEFVGTAVSCSDVDITAGRSKKGEMFEDGISPKQPIGSPKKQER